MPTSGYLEAYVLLKKRKFPREFCQVGGGGRNLFKHVAIFILKELKDRERGRNTRGAGYREPTLAEKNSSNLRMSCGRGSALSGPTGLRWCPGNS